MIIVSMSTTAKATANRKSQLSTNNQTTDTDGNMNRHADSGKGSGKRNRRRRTPRRSSRCTNANAKTLSPAISLPLSLSPVSSIALCHSVLLLVIAPTRQLVIKQTTNARRVSKMQMEPKCGPYLLLETVQTNSC